MRTQDPSRGSVLTTRRPKRLRAESFLGTWRVVAHELFVQWTCRKGHGEWPFCLLSKKEKTD